MRSTKVKEPRTRATNRHNPLAVDILESTSTLAKEKAGSGRKGKAREARREAVKGAHPAKIDENLLSQALEQQKEEDHPIERKQLPNYADSDDEISDDEVSELDEINEELVIDDTDANALSMFMQNDISQRRTIADIVMEKIKEFEEKSQQPKERASSLHPKIVQVYKGVGQVLKHYTAGKVPKAFKVIPSLNNWEEIVYLTAPHDWSLPSYYVATRLFASNLNEKMAQRFYNVILLPRVLEDIAENKRLNYHLYRALKKAVYKPAAFYKGIILPLCEENCTLLEATIVASVLTKVSVPILQSSAALYKLAQMPYNAASNIFIKLLLTKKYALPYRVVDKIVEFFSSFLEEKRKLPVIWHQTVLIFSQRYKEDLTKEQKDAIKAVVKLHVHSQISPEIHRELDSSCCRGEILNESDATMMML